jgi:Tol biopolymer transport system component
MKKLGVSTIIVCVFITGTFFLYNCGGGGGGEGEGDPVAPPSPIALVSVSSSGIEGNVESDEPVLSFNGRYVAFYTDSSNLVPDDTNNETDVFVRDMDLEITSRVSVSTAGTGGNSYSNEPAISYNGRYVVFISDATNLVPDDTNNETDVFVRDMDLEITSRVSVSTAGTQGNNDSYDPALSSDGRYVAFYSTATNLVPGDNNGNTDIFLRDTVNEITSLVSVSTAGTQTNEHSYDPAISSDGRYVAFYSTATNLVPGDNNGNTDIFLRDTVNEITSLVSVSTAGTQTNERSYDPAISSDGRYVVFYSDATNLVPDDTNNTRDVFVRDMDLGITSRASVSTSGAEVTRDCEYPSISPDGRYVAFKSSAVDLIDGETLSGIAHLFRAPRP